jgi:hypothetical protein
MPTSAISMIASWPLSMSGEAFFGETLDCRCSEQDWRRFMKQNQGLSLGWDWKKNIEKQNGWRNGGRRECGPVKARTLKALGSIRRDMEARHRWSLQKRNDPGGGFCFCRLDCLRPLKCLLRLVAPATLSLCPLDCIALSSASCRTSHPFARLRSHPRALTLLVSCQYSPYCAVFAQPRRRVRFKRPQNRDGSALHLIIAGRTRAGKTRRMIS